LNLQTPRLVVVYGRGKAIKTLVEEEKSEAKMGRRQ
jgi:hypothetical protein